MPVRVITFRGPGGRIDKLAESLALCYLVGRQGRIFAELKHVVSFSGPVVLCFAIGVLLDRHFETAPWYMLGGIVLGFVTGLMSILRLLKEPPTGE